MLFDSRKGHPCMIPAKRAGQTVKGELYRLRDNRQAFEILDIVEDFRGYGNTRSEFRRAVVSAGTVDGKRVPAWAYLYNRPTAKMDPIESGDWRIRPFLA
jgi:gamma-glutamylcyclotransferase (GGCT)/AIG2-like uncharacterized protein YtfP